MTTGQAADGSGFISFGAFLTQQARVAPHAVALVAVASDGTERVLSWAELESAANRVARMFSARGVNQSSMVVVALPNSTGHIVACSAAWKLGACVLPLNPKAPPAERDKHLALAAPQLVVAQWRDFDGVVTPADLDTVHEPDRPLPDIAADPGKVTGTGGSTGHPKLIVDRGAWGYRPDFADLLAGFGFRPEQVQLVPGPLHHSFGFDWCYHGLLHRHTVVLMERFDAALAVDLIERHRVQYAGFVPTMMRRIAQLPDVDSRDFRSIESILHSGGPCPESLKERWIELIGAVAVVEGYGATEGFGNTIIRGDEWRERRGSVGRPFACELEIRDDEGRRLPPGEVGEIWMRRSGVGDNYIGAQQARIHPDGFGSVGDLGWVDRDGYLFLADRRTDLIVSGGVNVYPTEVEGVLASHPTVADVVVIGLPDGEWGQAVHAIVECHRGVTRPTGDELRAHCRAQLAPYKTPRSFEFVDNLPRDDGGKIRRSALVSSRVAALSTQVSR